VLARSVMERTFQLIGAVRVIISWFVVL
jgi:hypothetical protein